MICERHCVGLQGVLGVPDKINKITLKAKIDLKKPLTLSRIY